MWLPVCRANCQPSVSKRGPRRLRYRRVVRPSGCNFDGASDHGLGQTELAPNLKAGLNGFLNVLQGLFFGATLTDATRKRWTLNDPPPILTNGQLDVKLPAHGFIIRTLHSEGFKS